jgi:regulation of enolase protein 1 (concanavalin A-like superfamily)
MHKFTMYEVAAYAVFLERSWNKVPGREGDDVTHAAEQVVIPRIPVSLRWDGGSANSYVPTDDGLVIDAGPNTDLFIDPQRTAETLDAPHLLACAEGDFQLSARVCARLLRPHDGGGLLVWLNDRAWAKFALEMSAQGEPEITSVVTRGASDRASGFVVGDDHVWLRIARVGAAYAFHASLDGGYWRLIRHFALYATDVPSYGFFAQSPTGAGCSATFDRVTFETKRLAQLRDGS